MVPSGRRPCSKVKLSTTSNQYSGSPTLSSNMCVTMAGAAGVPFPALRRRLCDRIAHHVRTILLTRLFGLLSWSHFAMLLFWILLFHDLDLRHPLVTVDRNRHRHRLGVRRPVNWQQRTPHPPNDWKQSAHELDGVCTNRDLLPVRAIADCQARHRTSSASAQVDDAPRKPRRCHASRYGRRKVGKGRRLNLLAAPNLLETPGNQFAHTCVLSGKASA